MSEHHDPIDKPDGYYFALLRQARVWCIVDVHYGLIDAEFEGHSIDPLAVTEWGRRIDIDTERRGPQQVCELPHHEQQPRWFRLSHLLNLRPSEAVALCTVHDRDPEETL